MSVLLAQKALWSLYLSDTPGIAKGISAMPSLHVAIAALNAIVLYKFSKAAGVFGLLYLAVILVGSVHLGWHYAIDGYLSILAVAVIWWATGWALARTRREEVQAFSS
jgi:hypothetical protein